MKVLLHYRVQECKKFTSKIIDLNKRYISNDFYIQKDLESTLEELQDFFKKIGDNTGESNISQLRTYLKTANSGINPITLEKIKVGKRTLIQSSVYHCLTQSISLLEHKIESLKHIIDTNTETLKQVLLMVFQSKLVTTKTLESINSIEKVKQFWNELIKNEQIDIINKKISLDLVKQDIYIILDKLIEQLKNNN